MIYERKRKEINAFAAGDEAKDTKGGEKLFRFFIWLGDNLTPGQFDTADNLTPRTI